MRKIIDIFWPASGEKQNLKIIKDNSENLDWEPGQVVIKVAKYFAVFLIILLLDYLIQLFFS